MFNFKFNLCFGGNVVRKKSLKRSVRKSVKKRVNKTTNKRKGRTAPKKSGKKVKYIIVTGGVLSGLGKGVVTASIANMIQSQGYTVSVVKIDPYINVDAGTMRPTEHGEVFVTDDGGETDQDIGTYERFLEKNFGKKNNITTGQVYQEVIRRERNLEFGGKCVEVIPHIPREVQRRVREVASEANADFIVVEVGGTIGDYQNILFLEAFREMHLHTDPVVFVHVVYLPVPSNIGEMKTKPAQHSIRALNSAGIQPDFVICRARNELDEVRKRKISMFGNVPIENVIAAPDLQTIYEEPLVFERQNFAKKLMRMFNLKYNFQSKRMVAWRKFVARVKKPKKPVKIAIVGKYFDIGEFTLLDSYISVIEAIKHASWNYGLTPEIQWIDAKQFESGKANMKLLKAYNGIIIPGGFGSSGIEGKINAVKYCRENKIPFLGLCYGLQMAVIEFSRNVVGLKGANSTEIDPNTKYAVVDIQPEQKALVEGKQYGATMRLGAYDAKLKKGSLVWELYGKKEKISERHRHRYEVNPEFIPQLVENGLVFSGVNPGRNLMEFIELKNHPFFVATQAHPELKSRPLRPSPVFLGFIKAASQKNGKKRKYTK